MAIKERFLKNGKKVYDVRVQYGKIRKSETVPTTYSNAKRVESKLLNELILGRFEILQKKENPTFKSYAEKYKETVQWHKSYKRTEISINHLKSYFGSKRLTEITFEDFSNYRIIRQKKVSYATINREHTCFLRMLNVAVMDDKYQIYRNPIRGLRKYKEPPAENRFLTVDEYHKLLEAAPEYFKRILFIACNTGMRKMEILNLLFGQIRIWHSGGEIELVDTKSGSKEYVPLNKDVVELIKTIAKEKSIDLYEISSAKRRVHVFGGMRGEKIKDIRKPLKKTYEKAGIDQRPFHTFRHFWTKMMFEAGIDPATIQTVGRWRDFETMLKYCYTTRSQEHDAVNKLTDRLKKKSAVAYKLRQYSGNN
jgi:integrase